MANGFDETVLGAEAVPWTEAPERRVPKPRIERRPKSRVWRILAEEFHDFGVLCREIFVRPADEPKVDVREELRTLGQIVLAVFANSWPYRYRALWNAVLNAVIQVLTIWGIQMYPGWVVTAIQDKEPLSVLLAIISSICFVALLVEAILPGGRDWFWGRHVYVPNFKHLTGLAKHAVRVRRRRKDGFADLRCSLRLIILRGRDYTIEMLEIFTRETIGFLSGVYVLIKIFIDMPAIGVPFFLALCVELWIAYVMFVRLKHSWAVRQEKENMLLEGEIGYTKAIQAGEDGEKELVTFRKKMDEWEPANKKAYSARAFYQWFLRGSLMVLVKFGCMVILGVWAAQGSMVDAAAFVTIIGLLAKANDPVLTFMNVQKRVIETREALELFVKLVGRKRYSAPISLIKKSIR